MTNYVCPKYARLSSQIRQLSRVCRDNVLRNENYPTPNCYINIFKSKTSKISKMPKKPLKKETSPPSKTSSKRTATSKAPQKKSPSKVILASQKKQTKPKTNKTPSHNSSIHVKTVEERLKVQNNEDKRFLTREERIEKHQLKALDQLKAIKYYLLYVLPLVFELFNYLYCSKIMCSLYVPGLTLVILLYPTLIIHVIFAYTHKYKKYQNLIHKKDHHKTERNLYFFENIVTVFTQILFVHLFLVPYMHKDTYIYVAISVILWLVVYNTYLKELRLYDKMET
jgi:hypothetical protein